MTNQLQKHYDKTNMVEAIADCLVQDHVDLLRENERLRKIEAAARNLVAVKGRHHSEIAYKQLEEVLK